MGRRADFRSFLVRVSISNRESAVLAIESLFVRHVTSVPKKTRQNEKAAILDALHKDLRQSPTESTLLELGPALRLIQHVMANLKEWVEPEIVDHPVEMLPGKSVVTSHPKGIVLSIAPWTCPFALAMEGTISRLFFAICRLFFDGERGLLFLRCCNF